MAFDGIFINYISKDLNNKLQNGRIDKIYQVDTLDLILNIRGNGKNHKLLISANPSNPRMHLTENIFENPDKPFNFSMALRKHLIGAKIISIEPNNFERIITMNIESKDSMGYPIRKKLMIEIMGKHSNIILVDHFNIIIDSIKRLTLERNSFRQILPSLEYLLPPRQDKKSILNITENDIEKITKSKDTKEMFMDSVLGISPKLAESISKGNIKKNIEKLINLLNSHSDIYIYQDKERILDFHFYPLFNDSKLKEYIFNDPNKALDFFYNNKKNSNRLKQKKTELESVVSQALKKNYLKKQKLAEDISKAKDSLHLKLYGELLTAYIHKVERGQKNVKVFNYYDNSYIDIKLDPLKTPSENAQNYFNKYRKANLSIPQKENQGAICSNTINYLEETLLYIEQAESINILEEITTELYEEGIINRINKKNKKRNKFKAFTLKLSSGKLAYIGRNSKENQYLSMKFADKKDVWFHTKNIHGSHVIIKATIDELTKEDIIQAAEIAAYYSKGRNSQQVPVDYVVVKNLKSPKGSSLGMVTFKNNKTVFVTPKLPNQ